MFPAVGACGGVVIAAKERWAGAKRTQQQSNRIKGFCWMICTAIVALGRTSAVMGYMAVR